MEDHKVLESVTEYENRWFDAGYDRVRLPDGTERNYYWAELSDAVITVPVTDDGKLVMVEQYRPAAQKVCLELPMGMVEAGESYCDAATRELREETGYKATVVEFLDTVDVATGILRHERGIVYVSGLLDGEQDLDDHEHLSIKTLDPESALDQPNIPSGTREAILLANLKKDLL